MFTGLGRLVYKLRYGIVAFWVVVVCAAVVGLPSLSSVVAHTETSYVPNSSEFVQAQNLLKQVDTAHQSTSSAVVALYNPKGLTSADKTYFRNQLQKLSDNEKQYGVSNVTDAYNTDKSLSNEFVSKDGTTEIATVGFSQGSVSQATTSSMQKVRGAFDKPPAGSSFELTGDAAIEQDNINISMDGVKRTTAVTIGLVLIILLLVFRSLLAPFVTLISIGLSFLLTQNVVGWLAQFGLPVSTFTQTFLVGVIFGAGTDYSIIIINRFREELTKDYEDVVSALSAALGAIGKTVLFSSLTVLVSFAVLYFAKFGLYRTAVGVSIGVGITLVLCFTLIPSIMAIFGRHLFWPRRPKVGQQHGQSKIWAWTGGAATRHPWISLLALIVVLVPTALMFTNQRTLNPMSDIPQAPSVQGFQVVSKAFSPGKVMPTTIVLKTTQNLRSPAGLTTIQKISEALAKAQGVTEVDSATQPTGKEISSFQLASQNGDAAAGVGKANNGVAKVAGGLSATAGQLQAGESGLNQVVSGAGQVSSGSGQLQQGLSTAATESQQLASGAGQVASASKQLNSAIASYTAAVNSLKQGAAQTATGLQQYSDAQQALATSLGQVASGATSLSQNNAQLEAFIESLMSAYPPTSANYQALQGVLAELQGVDELSQNLQPLNSGIQTATSQLPALVSGANQVASGSATLASSSAPLQQASQQLVQGAGLVNEGTNSMISGLAQLVTASGQLRQGSTKVYVGLQTLGGKYQQLPAGLTSAASGLHSVSSGLSQVQSFLKDSKQSQVSGDPGFYVPASTVSSNADLQKAMDAYISANGHIAKFTVVLDANPYSNAAIQMIPQLKQTATAALQTTPVHTGTIMATGTTAEQATLNQLSNSDFVRTVVLILSAIFLLLVIMLRSIVTPLYVILSLTSTYFVTMGIVQEVFVHVFGKAGVSWVVPFFAFLLLVALGVDYSIFLMTRFEEEYSRLHSFPAAILSAMKNMGNVIFSAALIMAGTFGSMTVSGVTSLTEIGTSVVIGLAVYSFVILAFFVPACATVINVGHLWPFRSATGDKAMDTAAPTKV